MDIGYAETDSDPRNGGASKQTVDDDFADMEERNPRGLGFVLIYCVAVIVVIAAVALVA
jgi:hypothetical protein